MRQAYQETSVPGDGQALLELSLLALLRPRLRPAPLPPLLPALAVAMALTIATGGESAGGGDEHGGESMP